MSKVPLARAADVLRGLLRTRQADRRQESPPDRAYGGADADSGPAAVTPSPSRSPGRAPVVVVEPGGGTRSVPLDRPPGTGHRAGRSSARARTNTPTSGALAAAAAAAEKQQRDAGVARGGSRAGPAALAVSGGFCGVVATFWALTHPVAAVSWSVALGGLALAVLCRVAWSESTG